MSWSLTNLPLAPYWLCMVYQKRSWLAMSVVRWASRRNSCTGAGVEDLNGHGENAWNPLGWQQNRVDSWEQSRDHSNDVCVHITAIHHNQLTNFTYKPDILQYLFLWSLVNEKAPSVWRGKCLGCFCITALRQFSEWKWRAWGHQQNWYPTMDDRFIHAQLLEATTNKPTPWNLYPQLGARTVEMPFSSSAAASYVSIWFIGWSMLVKQKE